MMRIDRWLPIKQFGPRIIFDRITFFIYVEIFFWGMYKKNSPMNYYFSLKWSKTFGYDGVWIFLNAIRSILLSFTLWYSILFSDILMCAHEWQISCVKIHSDCLQINYSLNVFEWYCIHETSIIITGAVNEIMIHSPTVISWM